VIRACRPGVLRNPCPPAPVLTGPWTDFSVCCPMRATHGAIVQHEFARSSFERLMPSLAITRRHLDMVMTESVILVGPSSILAMSVVVATDSSPSTHRHNAYASYHMSPGSRFPPMSSGMVCLDICSPASSTLYVLLALSSGQSVFAWCSRAPGKHFVVFGLNQEPGIDGVRKIPAAIGHVECSHPNAQRSTGRWRRSLSRCYTYPVHAHCSTSVSHRRGH